MRSEDGNIIHECINGEAEAFGMLVDKYKEGIYAFVYGKLRDFQDAQDVTQDVFLQAYRDLHSLRRWESFVFWLYRIASTRCKLWLRSQSRRVDRDFVEDQPPKAINILSLDSYRKDQLSEALREALDSLPEVYRVVLMLYYFGGMSIKDIARAVGASPTAIGKRLSRARSQLREEMVAMAGTAFEGRRLPAGFTFRIVEAVKRIKISPMTRISGLPWALSLAAGIFTIILSLGQYVPLQNLMSMPSGSALPSQAKVLKAGEITVDILKISQIPFISSSQGDGEGGALTPSDQQRAFFLAPFAKDGTWVRKADMPTPRSALATGVVNGKIYAIGGGANDEHVPKVEEYDPATDTWAGKSDMLAANIDFAISVFDKKIYAIGGKLGSADKGVSRVEEYDPAKDAWRKRADMPTPRFGLATSEVNGKIYAIGGISLWIGTSSPGLQTVEEYDPNTDTWTARADMPTGRYWLSTSAVGGKIYAIGGYNGSRGVTEVEEYDPMTDTWKRKADLLPGRACLAASVVDGRIYAIGGKNALGRLEEYDPVADKWTKKANLPTTRLFLSASTVNGRIYAIGGTKSIVGGVSLSTVEEYDPGFALEEEKSISARGKIATTWGKVK